jgi:Nickel responsive protein SCO4226-like
MRLFVIERRFAEQLDLTGDDVELIEAANAEAGVRWLFSFLTADRQRTYCLYESPSPDALLDAAERAHLPADVIVEVSRVSADSIRAGTPAGA